MSEQLRKAAENVVKTRAGYGWSTEADKAIHALERALAQPASPASLQEEPSEPALLSELRRLRVVCSGSAYSKRDRLRVIDAVYDEAERALATPQPSPTGPVEAQEQSAAQGLTEHFFMNFSDAALAALGGATDEQVKRFEEFVLTECYPMHRVEAQS